MGSAEEAEAGFEDERPAHTVSIGHRFAVGRFPVTFAEYDAFCTARKRKPPDDAGWGRDRQPLIDISWEDARTYLMWLTRETGRTYRFLTEAEWEYACRAGSKTQYSFGDAISPKLANYGESRIGRTREVGAYASNAWGLHDMHGGVWEWVEDDWHDNYQGAPIDGSAWKDTSRPSRHRVQRGGSWLAYPRDCRSTFRHRGGYRNRDDDVGLRVARVIS
jgi:formylglycine-generating enzyme required for sulfatase activity